MARLAEQQYLDLMSEILERGDERRDRTGVGTRSLFGATLRFDLSGGTVPILTTKRVYWKAAVRELLWFITGSTNIRPLLQENVRIWTDWPLAAYRRATGDPIGQEAFEARILADEDFARRWGELGPVYGKQWRRWLGADGREVDQIAGVVDLLRTSPSSRRMLFHAWNPPELADMALPPCHMVYQYHTTSDGRLNGLLFQRSCDLFLGAPWNLVEGAVLLMMLAKLTGHAPGEFVWFGGDVHLYLNHLDQARTQIARAPRPFPRMRIVGTQASIDDFRIGDFVVDGYAPADPIAAEVAV